jgi:3-deoxy-D-manno-octulosonic-acid transferase
MSPVSLRPSPWYRLAVATAAAGGWVVARFNPKLARGLEGRRGLDARLAAWGASGRDTRRPLAWFHAPSVGEGLQVKPVIDALRAAHTDWQLAYTFFSPSAERLAHGLSVDFTDYLPFDRPHAIAAALEALNPTALVFGKLDVWPELALAAARRGTRLGLISATVSLGSSRLSWPVRPWAMPAYAALDRIGAIAEADAARLERLGARPQTITITGDTRYDSVAARVAQLDRQAEPFASLARDGRGAFTIVAGSTWPTDERVLLPAFADLAARTDGRVRLILAPHEPTAVHLAGVAGTARQLRLPEPVPLSRYPMGGGETSGTLILVDRVGLLADLYALAEVAYVGGGYHRAGLHSVIEPAAFGVPVCVGPRWEMSRDAGELIRREAAIALPGDGRAALVAQWLRWRDDPTARQRAGAAAATVVKEGQGATARTVALVRELVAR